MSSLDAKRAEPWANLLAGGVGGLASLVVGHPFDTVKVRLQTQQAVGGRLLYSGARDCLAQLVAKEGIFALYRGMAGLALTSVPRFALVFYANSWGRFLVQKEGQAKGDLTLSQVLFGGVFSQLFVAPLMVAPLERVKVLLQVHPGQFSGQIDCLRLILHTEGLRGVFRGALLTLARDVPAFCSYFATYEMLRSQVKQEDGRMSLPTTALIGGVSGVLSWAIEIPLDGLKSRYQVCLGQKGLSTILKNVIKEGGLRHLYRGAGVVLLRAFPANSATFIGYEWTIRGLVLLQL